MRCETALHHFANVARGGLELDTGSKAGSINDADNANNFTLGAG
jgi:hypothetical protein